MCGLAGILSRNLRIWQGICSVTPTMGTHSLQQGQDEFYFSRPGHPADQATFIFKRIATKRPETRFLQAKLVLVESATDLACGTQLHYS